MFAYITRTVLTLALIITATASTAYAGTEQTPNDDIVMQPLYVYGKRPTCRMVGNNVVMCERGAVVQRSSGPMRRLAPPSAAHRAAAARAASVRSASL